MRAFVLALVTLAACGSPDAPECHTEDRWAPECDACVDRVMASEECPECKGLLFGDPVADPPVCLMLSCSPPACTEECAPGGHENLGPREVCAG
jgi:hypothetical protein